MTTKLRNIFLLLAVVGCCVLPSLAFAQAGIPLWTNYFDGSENGLDIPKAIEVANNGNVYVTGYTVSTNHDYLTIAYLSAGVPLWTNRYDGPANHNDEATALAVDSGGNIYVTGVSGGTGGFYSDFATVAYSSAGAPLWTNRYNKGWLGGFGPYYRANAIAVSSNGDVYVTGGSTGDYATVAYTSGGTPLWTNLYIGGGAARACAVGADTNGNVFVTGYSSGSDNAYVTIAYSVAGTPVWTNRYSSTAMVSIPVNTMAVDRDGDVYVAGPSWNGNNNDYVTIAYSSTGVPLWTNNYNSGISDFPVAVAIWSGTIFVTGGSGFDFGTIAYSSTGMPLWTNRYDGPGGSGVSAAAVDGSGIVYVTGSTGSGGSNDYATVAYSSAGLQLWTNLYDGPGNGIDHAIAVAVDNSGSVYVTGQSWNGSSDDFATIKYAPTVSLHIEHAVNDVILSWNNSSFGLESAPTVTGKYTNVFGAISPHTNSITDMQQFFRLKMN